MKSFWVLFLIFLILPNSVYSLDIALVKKEEVNIRLDSTISSDSLGFLHKGEKVEVIGKVFEWFKIRLPRRFSCYVSLDYITTHNDNTADINVSSLNLRLEPALNALIIGKVKKGNILYVLEKTDKWARIQAYPHVKGFIHEDCLDMVVNKNNIVL